MRVAVVGKGGSGKTSVSGVLARSLARQGHQVVGLDCDTNPNLGLSLGVGDMETERLLSLRDQIDEGEQKHAHTWADILETYGTNAPDGVRLTVVNRIDNPEPD
jgi:CO dehydrogenase maturation factor